MSNPHFLRTGKIEDADAAGTNSNFIDLRPSTSSPRAQPRALAQGTQPDPKDLRAAEVFGGSTNPFRRGPYSQMASSSTAASLESPRRLYPENNPFSDQARLRRAQTQVISSSQIQQNRRRPPPSPPRGSSHQQDSDKEYSSRCQEGPENRRRPPPPPPPCAPSAPLRRPQPNFIAQEAPRRPQPNSIQQEARRRPNPASSPEHRRTKPSFQPLPLPQQQLSHQEDWRGYTTLRPGIRISSTMPKLGEEENPFWSPEGKFHHHDLTPETIANQAAFDEWKRQQNVFWVDDSLLADDHFEPYKKAAPKDSPRRYEPHHRTRNEHSSHTRRNELGAKSRVRGPNEYRSQNRVTVMGPQNEPSSSNRGIDRTVDRQLSSSRSMPMLNGGSLGSSFIFPSTRPNRPSEDTKPKLSAIAASPQARGAPPCGSENTSHRRISSMASILSFGRHKDDAEKAEKAKEKEENKRLEKAAKEQKEKEEKERKERFKDYTQRELKRAKDLEAARKKRVEDAMEIEERRELERQIAGGEVVLGSREQRDGGYGVEDRERDRVRRQRGGGVAYLGR